MKRFLILVMVALGLFLVEFFICNFIGKALMPNLLLILIIYSALEMKPTQTLGVAIFAGLMKDSYSINLLSTYLVSFVTCALFILFIKKWIYHEASRRSRLIIVFSVCVLNFFIQYFLHLTSSSINFFSAVRYVLLPELIITIVVSFWLFQKIKKCVLKLSV